MPSIRLAGPALFLLIFLAGLALRLSPPPAVRPPGLDAYLYSSYVEALSKYGLGSYPQLVASYIKDQTRMPGALLPPTRFLYIFCGSAVQSLTGLPAISSLRWVSCGAGILALLITACFAWRLAGGEMALGTSALMAFAPCQIFLAKYPMIDGFFACLALGVVWLLWENVKTPNHYWKLAGYSIATALLVMTKENSAFVMLGLCGVIFLNQWLRFGKVTFSLIACTALGPVMGLTLLVILSGGVEPFVETYRLLVTKAYVLDYAIKTGDGPWHRYLFDYALVSPLIVFLSIGAVFQLPKLQQSHRYLIAFVCLTYVIMANVKFGMNLRYAGIWDMPLRFLAFTQLGLVAANAPRYRGMLLAGLTLAVCGVELVQYHRLFIESNLVELVSEDLLRALRILK